MTNWVNVSSWNNRLDQMSWIVLSFWQMGWSHHLLTRSKVWAATAHCAQTNFFFRGMATFFRGPTTFFRWYQKSNYTQKTGELFQRPVFDCFRLIQSIPVNVSTSYAPKPPTYPAPKWIFYPGARFRVPQPACQTHIFSVNHTHIFSKPYTNFQ